LTCGLGCAFVFVDQASEDRSASDPPLVKVRGGMIGAGWEKSLRPMWSPTILMGAVLGKDGPQVPLTEDQDAVGESVRAVSTNRSAKQFALGHRGGIFTVSMPASASTASNDVVN
jgi:hypothetical protein